MIVFNEKTPARGSKVEGIQPSVTSREKKTALVKYINIQMNATSRRWRMEKINKNWISSRLCGVHSRSHNGHPRYNANPEELVAHVFGLTLAPRSIQNVPFHSLPISHQPQLPASKKRARCTEELTLPESKLE